MFSIRSFGSHHHVRSPLIRSLLIRVSLNRGLLIGDLLIGGLLIGGQWGSYLLIRGQWWSYLLIKGLLWACVGQALDQYIRRPYPHSNSFTHQTSNHQQLS